LYRIGKIKTKKYKTVTALCDAIENEFYIKILPFAKQHTQTLSKLKIADGHNDPFDHAIISHAITDKLILVSSDRKFNDYVKQNLNFVFNRR
jgi:tRNA(fMet)-specific endonuclease VapC